MNDLSNMYMKSLDTTTPTFVETTHRHTQHRHTQAHTGTHTDALTFIPYRIAVWQYVSMSNIRIQHPPVMICSVSLRTVPTHLLLSTTIYRTYIYLQYSAVRESCVMTYIHTSIYHCIISWMDAPYKLNDQA